MSRWPHLFFCIIWLGTAIVFARLAVDSYVATQTTLARFNVHFPSWGSVAIMGVDLPKTMTAMADTNNANVAALEKSIRASAHLTLRLNVFSALLAIAGLIAQIGAYYKETRNDRETDAHIERASEGNPIREGAEFSEDIAEKDDGHTAD